MIVEAGPLRFAKMVRFFIRQIFAYNEAIKWSLVGLDFVTVKGSQEKSNIVMSRTNNRQ